jgi:hypothetical protein
MFITAINLWSLFFIGACLIINLASCLLYGAVWLRTHFKERYIFGLMAISSALFVFHNAFFFILQMYPTFRILVFPGYVTRTLYVVHIILGLVSLGMFLLAPILLTRFIFSVEKDLTRRSARPLTGEEMSR